MSDCCHSCIYEQNLFLRHQFKLMFSWLMKYEEQTQMGWFIFVAGFPIWPISLYCDSGKDIRKILFARFESVNACERKWVRWGLRRCKFFYYNYLERFSVFKRISSISGSRIWIVPLRFFFFSYSDSYIFKKWITITFFK